METRRNFDVVMTMQTIRRFVLATRLYILVFPFALFLTGAALNQAVLAANGGKFPVMLNEAAAARYVDKDGFFQDRRHCRMTSETRLNFLADYINVGNTMSPGDLLIDIGLLLNSYAIVLWMALVCVELYLKTEQLSLLKMGSGEVRTKGYAARRHSHKVLRRRSLGSPRTLTAAPLA